MARTQVERRSETRRRLLDAAAAVFAERGVDGASVDAIADAAGRTSGSVYAHFGSKDGLLFELLDEWMDQTANAITAELLAARTLDEQLAVLWRNIVNPPTDELRRWVALEHELWRWATRDGNDAAQARLARRYAGVWDNVSGALRDWEVRGDVDPPLPPAALAPFVVALLIGLEMQARVAPDTITDQHVVTGLRALLGASNGRRRPRRKERE